MFRQIDNLGVPSQVGLLNGILRELYREGERTQAALSGGGEGQVLAKASPGELDTEWVSIAGPDGWWLVREDWTYASPTTVTVPAGAMLRYQKGDKIRFTQNGSYKYFCVCGVTDTVLTLLAGSAYSVSDAPIIDVRLSRAESPFGFPGVFSLSTPVWTSNGTPFTNQPLSSAWTVRFRGAHCILRGVTHTHTASGATGIFYAHFAAGQIPRCADAAGTAYNADSRVGGFCFTVYNVNDRVGVMKYDGTRIAGDNQWFVCVCEYMI